MNKSEIGNALTAAMRHLESMTVLGSQTGEHAQARALLKMVTESFIVVTNQDANEFARLNAEIEALKSPEPIEDTEQEDIEQEEIAKVAKIKNIKVKKKASAAVEEAANGLTSI